MSDFTIDYQLRMLAWLCGNDSQGITLLRFLKLDYFDTDVTSWLYETISKFYKEYRKAPDGNILDSERQLHNTVFLSETEEHFTNFIQYTKHPETINTKYVQDSIREFITTRQLMLTLNEQEQAITTGGWSSVIQALQRDQPTFQQPGLTDIYTFSLLNLQDLYAQAGGMKTNTQLIDLILGGLYRKELTMLMSGTNVGKSLVLTCIGANLLRNGYKVLHVTLEMSIPRSLVRYFTSLSEDGDQIGYADIINLTDTEHVFNYVVRLRNQYEHLFHIAELPTGRGTVEDMYQLVNIHQPDVLIIDYLDLMKAAQQREAKRIELAEITTDLRGLAVSQNIAVLTATQTRRQAQHRRIINLEEVAEDYEKVRISDNVIGIGQNQQDSQRSNLIMAVAKSRNTERGFPQRYLIDFERMRLQFMQQLPNTFADEEDD